MSPTCPNCDRAGLEVVYSVRDIPVHSCLLMETAEEARAFPTGDLDLAWCRHCGFSTNTLFDVEKNAYSTRYEEVQTFSPTFNRFASELIEGLVEKRGVRGKHVVEIGCGKGEFLLELCSRGDNRGVGIDPSFVPGRGDWTAEGRVRFLNELYAADRHGEIPADLVVCRHTLEHIADTRRLVQTVRETIGDRPETMVFFELPDQERVYAERAFWDVYYEHCSYFTAGALERVFLDCGFDVIESWKGFGDQYLLIEARPLGPGEAPSWTVREDLSVLRDTVEAYSREMPVILDCWRTRFADWAAAGKRVCIWGAGSKGVAFLTSLGVRDEVAYAVDINPHKQGFFLPGTGHEVRSPESLVGDSPDVVIIMNGIYEREIARQLRDLGLTPEIVALA